MRTLIIAAILLAAPAVAQPGHQKLLGGNWRGIGLQVGPQGVQSTWTIDLSIDDSRIDYPSLGCKAVLHPVMRTNTQVEFREQITEGPCIDDGRISATLRDGRLYWFWSKPSAGADASAVLYRGELVG